jgi:hypothetical protein
MSAQPLGLTYKDMLDQATIDELNNEVKALLTECNEQMLAEAAIDEVADKHGFVVVEADGGTTLVRNEDGKYAVIWYESEFGQARFICGADDYEQEAIGFDNQTLGWANAE